ncbi:excalibur calcium-binding domain-containing protein [Jeotgalibacillus aurantiacus]|uniref:excalibur calcium-binding domain-containing protein n=1 Tax=Jeotgalibacillus aurantiacus TaxID=2763266 RepID=UPI001D0BC900|nr:excalibur calcium-binding domain-containing protein [Jeotgalibacillus aurantiacus]
MWLLIVCLIVFLILLFNFPLFTIGAALASWGIYEWNTNKKLKAKSRKPAAILSVGLVMALTGCVITVSNPDEQIATDTQEAESAEVAAEAEEAERVAAEAKEAEEKAAAEQEAKEKADAEAKKKAEEEAAAKKQAEEEAVAIAAKEKAEEEAAKKKAEEESLAKKKAEEEAAALALAEEEAAAQEAAEAEAAAASAPPAQEAEFFDNCTHLRTVYPGGVAADHPAYQDKMDRDNDGWACEN